MRVKRSISMSGLLAVMGLIVMGVCAPGASGATEAKWVKVPSEPPAAKDVVTVLYRGKTQELSGKVAKAVREAGLALLKSSGRERAVDNDPAAERRYSMIRNRSYVRITFAKPLLLSRASNPKMAVRVKEMVIPFSPDLDPEVVYVHPGKPFRMFAEVMTDGFQTIRTALIDAGIYPPEGVSLRVEQRKDKNDLDVLKRAAALHERGDYRGVCRLLKEPLGRLKKNRETRNRPEVTTARFQFADSLRHIGCDDESIMPAGAEMSAETRTRQQEERRRALEQAAEEFAALDTFLASKASRDHLTAKQRMDVPVITAKCWFLLENFDKALAIYERMIDRYPNQIVALDALGGAVQCHAMRGQIDRIKERLAQIQEVLPKMPEEVRKTWEPLYTECIKQLKDLPTTTDE